jgi:hypothetical protein
MLSYPCRRQWAQQRGGTARSAAWRQQLWRERFRTARDPHQVTEAHGLCRRQVSYSGIAIADANGQEGDILRFSLRDEMLSPRGNRRKRTSHWLIGQLKLCVGTRSTEHGLECLPETFLPKPRVWLAVPGYCTC